MQEDKEKKWTTFSGSIVHLMRCAFNDWIEDRAASKGAALAFYTLFSIAPILILVIAVAGYFFGREAATGQLFHQIQGLVGTQSAEAIQVVLKGASDKDDGLLATLVASALLLFGATTAFAELKDSLDEIWGLPAPTGSGFWDFLRTRLLSFGLVLALGFLLLVSLVVSAGLSVLENYLGGIWKDATVLMGWVASAVSFLVITALFAVIYKMLPRIRLAWRDVVTGAIGTAAMFTLGKFAIGAYIGNSGVADSFGAAGSLVALLLWVYYSAQVFFFGAEFTRQYALQCGSLRNTPQEEKGKKPTRA
jgi:membrane protein